LCAVPATRTPILALAVLAVEDEFLLRCSVTDRLREAGYSVVETARGEEAIAFCKSNMSIDMFTDIGLVGLASVGMWGNVFELIGRMSR
jgi:CheY-like chemotaxis protein